MQISFHSIIKVATIFFLILFSQTATNAQEKKLKIGDTAPELKLTKLLQGQNSTLPLLSDLKGKVVVLEFWATWCGTCIPAMEHLNDLAQKFKDKPVQFIAITSENEARIKQYLEKKPCSGWMGLDEKDETFNAYKFLSYPHSVVIDANGKIAAVTLPKNITESTLTSLLGGNSISLPLKEDVAFDLEWDKDLITDDTLLQFSIRTSNSTQGASNTSKPNRFIFDGVGITTLFPTAYQIDYNRTVFNLSKTERELKYRASLVVPKGQETSLYPIFQQLLQNTFNIKVRREMRETDVLLLQVIESKKNLLQPSTAPEANVSFSFGQGNINGTKQPISKLTGVLENFIGKPVIDNTGLKGKYDWNLSYNSLKGSLKLTNSLAETMGLELVQAKRPVEFLIFEREILPTEKR